MGYITLRDAGRTSTVEVHVYHSRDVQLYYILQIRRLVMFGGFCAACSSHTQSLFILKLKAA